MANPHAESGRNRAAAALQSGLGKRAGICACGWPHPFDPDNCELDSVAEEDITNANETPHEVLSSMREHLHRGCPTKWDLLRAHADPDHPAADALDEGHGAQLKPLTTTRGGK